MKVLTFGEIMLRLKVPKHERFFQSPMLEATFGCNTLWGLSTLYIPYRCASGRKCP